ncbi:MAG: hypothetical protein WCS28_09745 [Thiomicrospira sp.]
MNKDQLEQPCLDWSAENLDKNGAERLAKTDLGKKMLAAKAV